MISFILFQINKRIIQTLREMIDRLW